MVSTRLSNWTVHLNTAEVRDFKAARDFLAAPHVRVAYLLHASKDWIDYCLAQSNIEMIVVRPYNAFRDNHAYPDETLHHRRNSRDPLGWLFDYYGHYRGNPKIRWIFTNEPEHNQNSHLTNIAQQMTWIADHAQSLAENGFGCAMGGWAAAKTIRIENGKFIGGEDWAPVLRIAEKYPEWLHLDFHEYKAIHLLVGYLKKISLGHPQTFLDWRALTDTNNWDHIPHEGPLTLMNYYVGRRHNVREWARANGFRGDYHEGLGECPFDSMWENHWKDFIDKTFEPLFGKPKGLPTLRRYMAWLHYMKTHSNIQTPLAKSVLDASEFEYTDRQFCEDTIQQAEWWQKENSEYNLYNAWFAYTNNVEWRDNTDISQPQFKRLIEWMKYEQPMTTSTQPPTDTTVPLAEEFIRSTGIVTYIRERPTTEAAIVGSVPAVGLWAIVSGEEAASTTPELNWRYVEIIDTEVRGYVAFAYIDRTQPPSIEIRIKLNPRQISALQAQLKNTP